jgi:A/G-specific adenine glycosylase
LAIEAESTPAERLDLATGLIAETLNVEQSTISKSITSHKFHEPVKHIFSHINMTYHVLHLVLAKGDTIKASGQSVWWTAEEVESGNVGTGVKKCWAEVYGEWGSFEAGGATKPAAAKKTVKKRTRKVDLKAKSEPGEKLVKKVMMPMMPSR